MRLPFCHRTRTVVLALTALFAGVVTAPNVSAADSPEPWIAASPTSAPIGATLTITGYLDCSASGEGQRQPVLILLDPRLAETNTNRHFSTHQYWGPADLAEDGTFSKSVTIPTNLSDHPHSEGEFELAVVMHPPLTPGLFKLRAVCWPTGGNAGKWVTVEAPFTVTGPDGELPTTTTTAPPPTTAPPTTTTTTPGTTTTSTSPTTTPSPPTTAEAQVLAKMTSRTTGAGDSREAGPELARTGSKHSLSLTLLGSTLVALGAVLVIGSRRRRTTG